MVSRRVCMVSIFRMYNEQKRMYGERKRMDGEQVWDV